MPESATPSSNESEDENLLDEELVRAIHAMLVTDYEAKRVVNQLAGSVKNWRAQRSLEDIEQDELIHVGEMLKFLRDFSVGAKDL